MFHAADDFVVEVYAAPRSFPKDETYGLTSQMRRAVVSVPAKIVEGSARDSEREFLQEPELDIRRGQRIDRPGDLKRVSYLGRDDLGRTERLLTSVPLSGGRISTIF